MTYSVSPKDLVRDRKPGISGFMRLRNEAYLLNQAIETHLDGLDELILVHNECDDETPAICHQWADKYPDKIRVFDYAPSVTPLGTPESLSIDDQDENSLANYYNFALCKTTRDIVIKVDGDHAGCKARFARSCDAVRAHLKRREKWPIFGINVADTPNGVAVYNFYDFAPQPVGPIIGPPPFTTGDQSFYYIDDLTWHTTDRTVGYEKMPLAHKTRARRSHDVVLFSHCKGFKPDFGTQNWKTGAKNLRQDWIDNVSKIHLRNLASMEEMAEHNPSYFAGFDYRREFTALFPERRLYTNNTQLKRLPIIRQAVKNRLLDRFLLT